jgi:hypothetical protein
LAQHIQHRCDDNTSGGSALVKLASQDPRFISCGGVVQLSSVWKVLNVKAWCLSSQNFWSLANMEQMHQVLGVILTNNDTSMEQRATFNVVMTSHLTFLTYGTSPI